jgi:hypothetical protein
MQPAIGGKKSSMQCRSNVHAFQIVFGGKFTCLCLSWLVHYCIGGKEKKMNLQRCCLCTVRTYDRKTILLVQKIIIKANWQSFETSINHVQSYEANRF